jgi:hypothetical protein
MLIGHLVTHRHPHARRDTARVHISPCRTGAAIQGARGTPGPTRARAQSTIDEPTSGPTSAPTVPCFLTSWVRHGRWGTRAFYGSTRSLCLAVPVTATSTGGIIVFFLLPQVEC